MMHTSQLLCQYSALARTRRRRISDEVFRRLHADEAASVERAMRNIGLVVRSARARRGSGDGRPALLRPAPGRGARRKRTSLTYRKARGADGSYRASKGDYARSAGFDVPQREQNEPFLSPPLRGGPGRGR